MPTMTEVVLELHDGALAIEAMKAQLTKILALHFPQPLGFLEYSSRLYGSISFPIPR